MLIQNHRISITDNWLCPKKTSDYRFQIATSFPLLLTVYKLDIFIYVVYFYNPQYYISEMMTTFFVSLAHFTRTERHPLVMFRYHEDGSKKLNACSSCIFCMVFFITWTQNLIIHRSYIATFTPQSMLDLTQPLAPCCPMFTYLETQLLCWWWRILIHSGPWSANNFPTLW